MHGKAIYEFGPFRLDPHEHSLLKNGKAVNLSPQLFSLLVVFVENGGHLLTKEELRKKLWGDHHYIAEDALKVVIGNLRKALGEGRNGERYIENVFGKGYRFIRTVILSEQETLERGPTGLEIFPAAHLPAESGHQPKTESNTQSHTSVAGQTSTDSASQLPLLAFRFKPRTHRFQLLAGGLTFTGILTLVWLFIFAINASGGDRLHPTHARRPSNRRVSSQRWSSRLFHRGNWR
jgi:DNA-binding winged helix-turn-helix (wHTH) protein